MDRRQRRARFSELLAWLLAGLGLYAASLSILGAVEALSRPARRPSSSAATPLSAPSGASSPSRPSLVGLRRGLRALRLAALGLFALALGKLFLYDLSTLHSVTRALSFLAVGAVLLLAGFFYQRLTEVTETT